MKQNIVLLVTFWIPLVKVKATTVTQLFIGNARRKRCRGKKCAYKKDGAWPLTDRESCRMSLISLPIRSNTVAYSALQSLGLPPGTLILAACNPWCHLVTWYLPPGILRLATWLYPEILLLKDLEYKDLLIIRQKKMQNLSKLPYLQRYNVNNQRLVSRKYWSPNRF